MNEEDVLCLPSGDIAERLLFQCKKVPMSQESYQAHWSKLRPAIDKIFHSEDGCYLPLSFEEISCCVFKCIVAGYMESLYTDLMQHVSSHVDRIYRLLKDNSSNASSFVNIFHTEMTKYFKSTEAISSVFLHLDKHYLNVRQNTSLAVQFSDLFNQQILRANINHLLNLLEESRRRPFSILPQIMQEIIVKIYQIDPEYAQLKINLFSIYIPNLQPACSIKYLDCYVQEAQQTMRDLQTHPAFIGGDQRRKRQKSNEMSDNSSHVMSNSDMFS